MLKKKALFPPELPRPRVAYSPAIQAGPFVFVSGQLASDLNTGTPADATLQACFGGTPLPTSTISVDELPIPGCRAEIDLVALVPEAGQRIDTLNPPAGPRTTGGPGRSTAVLLAAEGSRFPHRRPDRGEAEPGVSVLRL